MRTYSSMRYTPFLPFVVVLTILILGCGPLGALSHAGRGGPRAGGGVPSVFTDLPPTDPRVIAVNFAIAQDGKSYTQWPGNPALSCGRGGGGCTRTGPDCFDCSGLTQTAYARAGISLGPTTSYQLNDGISIPCTAADLGGAATTCWQPGDLALFLDASGPYHVAMYIYDGLFAEALNCDAGVLVWERPPSSMHTIVARRIIGSDGQPYAAQGPKFVQQLVATRRTP